MGPTETRPVVPSSIGLAVSTIEPQVPTLSPTGTRPTIPAPTSTAVTTIKPRVRTLLPNGTPPRPTSPYQRDRCELIPPDRMTNSCTALVHTQSGVSYLLRCPECFANAAFVHSPKKYGIKGAAQYMKGLAGVVLHYGSVHGRDGSPYGRRMKVLQAALKLTASQEEAYHLLQADPTGMFSSQATFHCSICLQIS